MQLQPYQPYAGALVAARRHTGALTLGAALAGAVVAGAVAVGRALMERSGEEDVKRAAARSQPTQSGDVVLRRVSVSMTVIEEWITPAGER